MSRELLTKGWGSCSWVPADPDLSGKPLYSLPVLQNTVGRVGWGNLSFLLSLTQPSGYMGAEIKTRTFNFKCCHLHRKSQFIFPSPCHRACLCYFLNIRAALCFLPTAWPAETKIKFHCFEPLQNCLQVAALHQWSLVGLPVTFQWFPELLEHNELVKTLLCILCELRYLNME